MYMRLCVCVLGWSYPSQSLSPVYRATDTDAELEMQAREAKEKMNSDLKLKEDTQREASDERRIESVHAVCVVVVSPVLGERNLMHEEAVMVSAGGDPTQEYGAVLARTAVEVIVEACPLVATDVQLPAPHGSSRNQLMTLVTFCPAVWRDAVSYTHLTLPTSDLV